MRRFSPMTLLALLLALAVASVACQSATDESLTDPRDILTRTLRAGSGLRTVTLRAELQIRDANNPGAGIGGIDGGVLEAQVDFIATEFTARAVSATGVEAVRVIAVDDAIFTSTANGRWQQMPIAPNMLGNPAALLFLGAGGGFGGDGPDVVGILGQAIREPTLPIEFVGVEDCDAGRCYRTAVEIPRAELWPLLVDLTGIAGMPGFQPPEPPMDDLPQIRLAVLTDTARLNPVEIILSGSVDGTTAHLRLQLANHDAPVSIQPPPPDLVDQAFGFQPFPETVPAQPRPAPAP